MIDYFVYYADKWISFFWILKAFTFKFEYNQIKKIVYIPRLKISIVILNVDNKLIRSYFFSDHAIGIFGM